MEQITIQQMEWYRAHNSDCCNSWKALTDRQIRAVFSHTSLLPSICMLISPIIRVAPGPLAGIQSAVTRRTRHVRTIRNARAGCFRRGAHAITAADSSCRGCVGGRRWPGERPPGPSLRGRALGRGRRSRPFCKVAVGRRTNEGRPPSGHAGHWNHVTDYLVTEPRHGVSGILQRKARRLPKALVKLLNLPN